MSLRNNYPVILAIETGTPVCSVALQIRSGFVDELSAIGTGVHSEKTFQFIQALLEKYEYTIQNISKILINNGPGSYTGLRIGASAAKGLLFDQKCQLYAVQSLASIAMGMIYRIPEIKTIHSVINARRTHLYHQQFVVANNRLEAQTEPAVLHLDEISVMCKPGDVIAGTGTNRLVGMVECAKIFETDQAVSAKSMIELFNADYKEQFVSKVNPVNFEPLYQLD